MSGFLIFMREDAEGQIDEDNKHQGMVVAVGGDSYQALALLLQDRSAARPLTVDLLWRVLERGQAISKQSWTILRVAIVDMTETAFIGRLWFGSKETGEVVWDVDCRPSDATWLAIKAKAPIFIHRRVWEEHAVALESLAPEGQRQLSSVLQDLHAHQGEHPVAVDEGRQLDATEVMTQPRRSDPEPLRRLKMEMRLALKEEDYATAARIRDHPFSKLHLTAVAARQEGDLAAANTAERALLAAIAKAEEAS